MAGRPPLSADPPEAPTLGYEDADPSQAWVVGERYEPRRFLARGASKQVYLAYDRELDRDVAVAILADAQLRGALRTRLGQEIRTTAQLGDHHPNILTVHDVGARDGAVWIISPYVRAGSVADALGRRPGGLPVADAVRIARQVAEALAFAHERGVIHRDVKPGNVLLAESQTALLADFGVALLAGERRLTSAGTLVGTAYYMAPEQAGGEAVDERSDVYGLGATLFEMVTGRPPFVGEPLAVLHQHVNRPPPDPRELAPAVPRPLADLILALLSKARDERPRSARAVCDALDAAMRRPAAGLAAVVPPPAPLPAPLARDRRRSFVGRRAEAERLGAAWRQAADRRPVLALVTGEPGIGKTTLAAAFAAEIGGDGATVLYGRCDEAPLVSYQPFVEALRQLLGHRPGIAAALDARWSTELAELGRLVPELRGRAATAAGAHDATAPPAPERYHLFEAVVELLSAGVAHAPLLLVVDDVQWADEPTELLLRHLLRATVPGPLMVLATARPSGPAGPAPPGAALALARADLEREGTTPTRLARVALEGLDDEETHELVRGRHAADVDPGFSRLLRQDTAGNPFFIEQVLRSLGDTDLSAAEPAARALRSLAVPETARELIEGRLAALTGDTLELLRIAAVCGREFRIDLLGELLGERPATIVERLAAPAGGGLVTGPRLGRYAFCHALVRETLYEPLARTGRAQALHLAVGEALERLDGDDARASELAVHFHGARDAGGAPKAYEYALAAAKDAAQALAYEEAAAYASQALGALEVYAPGGRLERCRILHSIGRLRWRAGDQAGAQEAFLEELEIARGLADHELLGRAALGYAGRSYEAERIDPQVRAVLKEALETTPHSDAALRARLLARYAEALHPIEGAAAEELAYEGVELARRSGDRDALVAALAGRHTTVLHSSHLDERLAVGSEWLRRAEEAGGDNLGQALHWRLYDLFELGDLDGAQAVREEFRRLADRLGQPLYLHFMASWDAKWAALAGRFADAEAKARETYRHGRRAQGGHVGLLYAGQLFGLRRDQGRLAEVPREAARLVGRNPSLPIWRAGLVVAYLEAGEEALARAELRSLAADGFAAIPCDMFWLGALCMLAEGAAALGDAATAAELATRLEPYGDLNAQVGLAFSLGPVHTFLATLAALTGRDAAADAHFATALEHCAGHGAVTAEARTQCEYGRFLLDRDDPAERDRARALLESSLATAQRTGMESVRRRASELLARMPPAPAAGPRPRRS